MVSYGGTTFLSVVLKTLQRSNIYNIKLYKSHIAKTKDHKLLILMSCEREVFLLLLFFGAPLIARYFFGVSM